MRWLVLLTVFAGMARGQEVLDDARVQVPYKEFRALLEAADKAKAPPPPVESAILSARYLLTPGETSVGGTAEFDVQTFRDGPHAVPLFGDEVIVEGVEPKEATLVRREGRFALALEGRQRTKVSIRFAAGARRQNDGVEAAWAICPAVTTAVQFASIPPGRHAVVENGIRTPSGDGETWRLGRSAELRVALRAEPKALPPPVAMPAIIPEASSEMRVVSDGAFVNRTTWRIRHQAPLVWKLDLPESCQLVTSLVGGRPVSPSRPDAKSIEFRLPEPVGAGETTVEVSYTGKVAAFQPVRGELELSLPATPLLVENLKWRVVHPNAYEIVAAQGNVEFLPGGAPGEVRLSKELGQGDAPTIRLFYQKPENRKQP